MKIIAINPAISSTKNSSVLPCRINDISVILGMFFEKLFQININIANTAYKGKGKECGDAA